MKYKKEGMCNGNVENRDICRNHVSKNRNTLSTHKKNNDLYPVIITVTRHNTVVICSHLLSLLMCIMVACINAGRE